MEKKEKIRPNNLTSCILVVIVTLDAGERPFPYKKRGQIKRSYTIKKKILQDFHIEIPKHKLTHSNSAIKGI